MNKFIQSTNHTLCMLQQSFDNWIVRTHKRSGINLFQLWVQHFSFSKARFSVPSKLSLFLLELWEKWLSHTFAESAFYSVWSALLILCKSQKRISFLSTIQLEVSFSWLAVYYKKCNQIVKQMYCRHKNIGINSQNIHYKVLYQWITQ